MATPHSRLALLPGYDTAPDVYETPELTTSASTASDTTSHPTSPRSHGDGSSATSDSDSDASGDGRVSRRRIQAGRARERFTRQGNGRGVEVRAGDFSDRVGGYRKGYRLHEGGRGGLGVQEESLEQRIARLRREVEECRIEASKGESGENGDGEAKDGVQREEEMDGLRKVLDSLDTGWARRRAEATQREAEREAQHEGKDGEGDTLGKVADFDARLAALERSLGPLDAGTAPAPVIPSLQVLDEQLSALMTANSLANLEASSARIRKLREEAEQISHYNSVTTNGNGAETPTSDSPQAHAVLPPEDLEQLKALHALLPNLQSLSPTVPALLDRLRSLRTLHAGAANAASELEDLERRQDDFDNEMKAWREGLERVEEKVREADEANGRNGKVVQGWVRGVEGRVDKLR